MNNAKRNNSCNFKLSSIYPRLQDTCKCPTYHKIKHRYNRYKNNRRYTDITSPCIKTDSISLLHEL